MKIVITEFIDERVLPALRAKHEVVYDAKLVDDPILCRLDQPGDLVVRKTGVRPCLHSRNKRVLHRIFDQFDVRDAEPASQYRNHLPGLMPE